MALSFIGKPISLISHSDVRYRGILAGIDPVASTIQLSNVFSMGTEQRRPREQFIPPVQEPYAYIIFRASEVKDLAVDEPQPMRNVHDDPAVLGASAPIASPAGYPYNPAAPFQPPLSGQVPVSASPHQRQQAYPQGSQGGQQQAQPAAASDGSPTQPGSAQPKSGRAIQNATASMESVERALDDLRVAGGQDGAPPAPHGGRGGRRGGRQHEAKTVDLKVPATDFDFQGSNARFDKSALGPPAKTASPAAEASPKGESEEADEDKDKTSMAYNPKSSFFDSLTSGSNAQQGEGGRGRGGRRGGGGRNRREEERERNVATFGEPGGIGLMGPGAYVGGWGGYGRRGGRGGRRGGGHPMGRQ